MLIWKTNNNKWHDNDVITKKWQNSDLRKTKQNNYHSIGIDESCPKIAFYWIWATVSKVMGIFVKFWLFLRCRLTKYGHVTWLKIQILKMFYFVLILHLIIGKVTKFPVEKLSTSEVISKKRYGAGKHPSPPPPPVSLRLTGNPND